MCFSRLVYHAITKSFSFTNKLTNELNYPLQAHHQKFLKIPHVHILQLPYTTMNENPFHK